MRRGSFQRRVAPSLAALGAASLAACAPSREELAAEHGSVNVVWDYLPGLTFDPVNEVVAGTTTPEDAIVQLQLSADQGARAAGLPGWE